ncbi:hypothetical protein BB050_04040 [Flavobacterium anhuiense]|uniref:Uncharacterized protein n=1 Tax=Flavobacterium anhuiense TaxID=459526 RepID=A0AAC9GK34_9FLAO|nr:hypothetical protein BB050_04040 [Flavobacterium anhuiense]
MLIFKSLSFIFLKCDLDLKISSLNSTVGVNLHIHNQ